MADNSTRDMYVVPSGQERSSLTPEQIHKALNSMGGPQFELSPDGTKVATRLTPTQANNLKALGDKSTYPSPDFDAARAEVFGNGAGAKPWLKDSILFNTRDMTQEKLDRYRESVGVTNKVLQGDFKGAQDEAFKLQQKRDGFVTGYRGANLLPYDAKRNALEIGKQANAGGNFKTADAGGASHHNLPTPQNTKSGPTV